VGIQRAYRSFRSAYEDGLVRYTQFTARQTSERLTPTKSSVPGVQGVDKLVLSGDDYQILDKLNGWKKYLVFGFKGP
jgi:hypothetical protein